MARSFSTGLASVLLRLLMFAAVLGAAPAIAATPAEEVQTSWRLLDYIAVDYREAIADGRVINQLEYDEMVEFSSTVDAKLAAPSHIADAIEHELALDRVGLHDLELLVRELGRLEKEDPYQNNVGYSERADVPIEPRLTEQWYVDARTLAKPACAVSGGPVVRR